MLHISLQKKNLLVAAFVQVAVLFVWYKSMMFVGILGSSLALNANLVHLPFPEAVEEPNLCNFLM